MATVRFRSASIDLELQGSEGFVNRQLLRFAPFVEGVDRTALAARDAIPSAPEEPSQAGGEAEAPGIPAATALPPGGPNGRPGQEGEDGLVSFFRSVSPTGRDRQADAALLFAYYLERREGLDALAVGDLIRCCIRAGVDTRNFNRAIGTLTRRGFLETVRHGHAYRLSEQGAAAVESRL